MAAAEKALPWRALIAVVKEDHANPRTLAFSTLVFGELFRAFAARSQTRVFWETGVFSNLVLLGVVAVSMAVQLGIHHIPFTQRLFSLGTLSLMDCALSIGVALVPTSVIELTKLARRALPRQPLPRPPSPNPAVPELENP